MYRESVLWSPEFTPLKFKYMFMYPAFFAVFLLWYIRYIQWPKKMMQLKKQKGISFPDLEAKGWLKVYIYYIYLFILFIHSLRIGKMKRKIVFKTLLYRTFSFQKGKCRNLNWKILKNMKRSFLIKIITNKLKNTKNYRLKCKRVFKYNKHNDFIIYFKLHLLNYIIYKSK